MKEKINFKTRLKASYQSKKFKNGAYSSLFIVCILVAVVLVSVIAGEFDLKLDVSEQSMFTLTDQTKEVLEKNQTPITLYYICESGGENDTIQNIVNKYKSLSDKITIAYKDPILYPTFTQEYAGVGETVENNSLVVVNESTGIYRYIPYSDMLELDYSYVYYGYSESPTVTGIDVEGQITSAIQYVASETTAKLYQVTGHGEAELSDNVVSELTKVCTTVETLEIRSATEIPEDCDLLLINGAQTDYSENEIKVLETYMEQGGNVVITNNYQGVGLTNLNGFMEGYGITVTDGIVFEDSTHSEAYRNFSTIPNVVSHDLTEGIARTINPITMGISKGLSEGETRDTVTITPFLKTSNNAYLKTGEFSTYDKEEGDLEGPFYAGVIATEVKDDVTSNLVVFSSSDIFSEEATYDTSKGNLTLMSNVTAYCSGQETGLSIPVRSLEETYITTTNAQVTAWTILLVIALPLLLLSAGFSIWYRRRKY